MMTGNIRILIQHRTSNPSVEYMLADLSAQSDVLQLAQQFVSRRSRLDVLVNNAGAAFVCESTVTP